MDTLFATPFDPVRAPLGLLDRKPSALSTSRLRRLHDGLGRAKPRRPATDRLFFAILPDPDTAAQIADQARHLRIAHGLTGKPLRPEHFHVTLCHVGDDVVPPPPELIEAVTERAASVAMPAFRVEFDRAMSFRNGAFVLSGDDSVIGLDILQQRLSDALDSRPGQARRYTPHLTLLRDGHLVSERPIEPIGWTAREVVLVHSLLGKTTHRHLAHFPLQ